MRTYAFVKWFIRGFHYPTHVEGEVMVILRAIYQTQGYFLTKFPLVGGSTPPKWMSEKQFFLFFWGGGVAV